MGATEDFRGAHRQCPLIPSQPFLAITAVWNEDKRDVQLHKLCGQPFGAARAVHNFNRVAEWVARVVRRMLRMVPDHYSMTTQQSSRSALSALACALSAGQFAFSGSL